MSSANRLRYQNLLAKSAAGALPADALYALLALIPFLDDTAPVFAGAVQIADLDVGASGTAGALDIFPGTAAKGKLRLLVDDQSTDTTITLTAKIMAAARALSIVDPLADADFLLGKMAAVARTVTVDGLTTGTIADGGRLQHITVTSDDANKILVLPTPTPGTIVVIHGPATGFELRSSAPNTVAINGGTGSAGESAIPANSTVIMICVTATAWKGFFLDADSDLAKVEAAAN